MSRRHDVQDATGIVVAQSPARQNFVLKTTTPTASASGFAVGCLWVNTGGSVGSVLYVNVGTVTSATWLNIA